MLNHELSQVPIKSRSITEKVDFDKKLAHTNSREFIMDVLDNSLGVKDLVVGPDFRFGRNRIGDVSMLIGQGTKSGFSTTIIPEVSFKNMKMSSSLLRNRAKNGEFSAVENMRRATLKLTGHVCHGNKLGRTLNFPTANIKVPKNLCFSGIFIVRVIDNSFSPTVVRIHEGGKVRFKNLR